MGRLQEDHRLRRPAAARHAGLPPSDRAAPRLIHTEEEETEEEGNRKERLKFSASVGFAARSAELYHQIRRKLGLEYLSEFPVPHPNAEMACLRLLQAVFLTGSCHSQRFRLRLVQTGIVQLMLNDVRHMQHLAADVLVSTMSWSSRKHMCTHIPVRMHAHA